MEHARDMNEEPTRGQRDPATGGWSWSAVLASVAVALGGALLFGCGMGDPASNSALVPASSLTCGPGTVAMGTTCIPESTLSCGAGTVAMGTACVPENPLACGPGTVAMDGKCVQQFVPGQYQNPLTLVYELLSVGSHTDEMKLRDDNVLLNCSYTFNAMEATATGTLRLKSATGGHTHVIPNDSRKPGCKHLAFDGENVFTTHFGNARNPAFLSGWKLKPDPMDAGKPWTVTQLPVLQEPKTAYQSIDVANHHIFVALHEQGLGVYTFEEMKGFTRVATVPGFGLAWGVAANGNRVVVADADGMIGTVDATDPTRPVLRGTLKVAGQPRGAVINGNYAYVSAGSEGLYVVDISDLARPAVAAHVDFPGTALRVAFADDRVYIAAWNDTRVYDVKDPKAPRFVAAVRVPRVFDYADDDREQPTHRTFGVAARGPFVYIGAWDHPFVYRLAPERQAPNMRLAEASVRTDFGPVAAAQTRTVPFTVTNQGTAPLTLIDNWTTNPAFSVDPRQARIEPGKSVDLMLTFRPAVNDMQTGFLQIRSDDPQYPVRKSYLVGNPMGVSVGTPLPDTTADMTDGSHWSSSQAKGSVLLISYFGTFCPVCANHLPDSEQRFWQTYQSKGLKMVALDSQEAIDVMPEVQIYQDKLQLTFPMGIETGAPANANTYKAIVANFSGPNPFPVDVIVDKKGIIRYATHEYDPDSMVALIEKLLAE